MHAFLILEKNEERVEKTAEKLATGLKAKIFPFPLIKIEDVRGLNKFTKLALDKPTAILIKNIQKTTLPAVNAFLKSLEEPQENLYYILSADSTHSVLPTIVSRCQIIRLKPNTQITNKNTEAANFLKMSTGEKLAFTDKIKDREQAINFVEEVILEGHKKLHQVGKGHLLLAKTLEVSGKTLDNLRANGNVTLQLANMAINT